MTTIGQLLDPKAKEGLKAVVADLDPKAPATVPYVVIKASTEPIARSTTTILTGNGEIEVDVASEANIEALCAGNCAKVISFPPTLPLAVAKRYGLPQPAAYCLECAEEAVLHVIQEHRAAQRNQPAIRTPRVAKHQPRVSDGIDHPVVFTTPLSKADPDKVFGPAEITPKKENDVDLDNIPAAKLGDTVRQSMKMAKAEQVKKDRKAAKKAQREAEQQALVERTKAQKAKKGKVLPGFMVGTTLEVPALDLSDVENIDECPSATARSPYNKARFRLTGEGPLPSPSACEEDASLVPTTYRVLADEHRRLMSLAADHNEQAKAKQEAKAKPKTAPKTAVIADLDTDAEALIKRKAKALAKATGLSKAQAREIVLAGL